MSEKDIQDFNDHDGDEEHYMMYNGLWGENLSQLKERLVFSRRSNHMLCIYCGEHAETREHCPPRSFFPEHEFPDNLRVLPACKKCNESFSKDEEIVRDYLKCIYDRFCHEDSKTEYSPKIKDYVEFTEQQKRPIEAAERIFMKVALGLAVYELSDCFGDSGLIPKVTDFKCRHWIDENVWSSLGRPIAIDVLPELGTRASNNSMIIQIVPNGIGSVYTQWIDLKEGVFSYITWLQDDFIGVKMIIRDYFYVEVKFYSEEF